MSLSIYRRVLSIGTSSSIHSLSPSHSPMRQQPISLGSRNIVRGTTAAAARPNDTALDGVVTGLDHRGEHAPTGDAWKKTSPAVAKPAREGTQLDCQCAA